MIAAVVILSSFLIQASVSLSYGQECECGIESDYVQDRVIGGRKSEPYTYPWVLYVKSKVGECTGSLISETFVLTAAHCVPEDGDVRGLFVSTFQGCYRLQFWSNSDSKYFVKRIIRHPGYGKVTDGNDIALLELKNPIRGTMPICLPGRKIHRFSNLIVAGWGLVSQGLKRVRLVDNKCLNEVELDVVSDRKCHSLYGVNSAKVMCAGGETGVCDGDSGGPLMTRVRGLFFQAGVTSFAREDCGVATASPAGFEKVSPHLDWIASNSQDACFK